LGLFSHFFCFKSLEKAKSAFCGNVKDIPALYKKAFQDGVVLSFHVNWDNGDEIIKDINISKAICKKIILKFDKKRKKERQSVINDNLHTMYQLGIYIMPKNSKKIDASKKYIQLKKEEDSFKNIINIEGKDLYFTKEVNYEIMEERQIYIHPFLWKEQFVIIHVLKVTK